MRREGFCLSFLFYVLWVDVKPKCSVGGGTAIAAQQWRQLAANRATGHLSHQATGKTNTSGEWGAQIRPACGLALLPSRVPARQMTFSGACKAGGQSTCGQGLEGRRNFRAVSGSQHGHDV